MPEPLVELARPELPEQQLQEPQALSPLGLWLLLQEQLPELAEREPE
ncbi:hypothetical protein GCM10027189_02270 [Rufibacter soli]